MFLEWKLERIRKKQQKKLNSYNKTVFKNISEYISCSSLDTLEVEVVLQQVLDMLLQSQEENKNINLFLGQDHKAFCDSIIAENNKAKSTVLKVIRFIELYLVTLLTAILVLAIIEGTPSFTLGPVIYITLICFIIFPYSRWSHKKRIFPDYKKQSYDHGCLVFIIYFFLLVITEHLLNKILNNYGYDISTTAISLFSVRYLLAIAVLFILGAEIYTNRSSKLRNS